MTLYIFCKDNIINYFSFKKIRKFIPKNYIINGLIKFFEKYKSLKFNNRNINSKYGADL